MPIQRFALFAMVLVRQGGVPAAIGLVAGVLAWFFTASGWAGLLFGGASWAVAAGIMASRQPT